MVDLPLARKTLRTQRSHKIILIVDLVCRVYVSHKTKAEWKRPSDSSDI